MSPLRQVCVHAGAKRQRERLGGQRGLRPEPRQHGRVIRVDGQLPEHHAQTVDAAADKPGGPMAAGAS
jgi:hypothetical protein